MPEEVPKPEQIVVSSLFLYQSIVHNALILLDKVTVSIPLPGGVFTRRLREEMLVYVLLEGGGEIITLQGSKHIYRRIPNSPGERMMGSGLTRLPRGGAW